MQLLQFIQIKYQLITGMKKGYIEHNSEANYQKLI